MWLTAYQLHTKLYSRKEELEKTAAFILQTRFSVAVIKKKRKKIKFDFERCRSFKNNIIMEGMSWT